MTDFQAINTTSNAMEHPPRPEVSTPTTPRPSVTLFSPAKSAEVSTEVVEMEDVAKTPTKDSFTGMAHQRALPTSPLQPHARSDSKMEAPGSLKREGSHKSIQSMDTGQDVEMGEARDEEEESDNESNGEPSKKKKKGQRFFCTDFPPCNLSFTRSEHLARHIRKHTGERPFQCHCSRRFSRLDNLRQHAQTVHVNEDIPGDSLAATGTRFQRQIRTDRVRTPGSRTRASTLGSGGTHSRGHSRNLSNSSMTSIASTVSSLGGEDILRRSTPIMASDHGHRSRLSLDTYGSAVTTNTGQQHYYHGTQSPSGYSTPTSATFPHGPGSPRFSSGFHSPIANPIPRSVTFEPRTPARRLSVPSAAAFTPPHNSSYASPYHSSVHSASGSSSMFASPHSSYGHSRAESASSVDVDLKRRTWHPNVSTGLVARPGTSGLQQWQAPEQSRPLFAAEKPSSGAPPRLPGIESFDHAPPPPAPRRVLSPMQIDVPQHQSLAVAAVPPQPEQRNNRLSWDSSQRGLSAQELERASQQAERGHVSFGPATTQESVRPSTSHVTFQEPPARRSFDESRGRASDVPATPSRKRMAWYNGPVHNQVPTSAFTPVRTSPDESGSSDGVPTPSNGAAGDIHPAIVHSNGYIEQRPSHVPHEASKMQYATQQHYTPSFDSNAVPQYTPFQHPPHQIHNATYALQQAQHLPQGPMQQRPQPAGNDMQRLEALVAVATRENQAVSGR